MSQHRIARGLAVITIAGASMVALPQAGLAHHSFSQFDRTKTLVLKGSVRKFEWMNPHVWLWVDVPDAAGKITTWGLEASAPGEMERSGGWTKRTLREGDQITVQVSPLKDGRHGGSMGQITLADGKILGGRKDGGGPPSGGGGGPGGAPAGFGAPAPG